MKATIEIEFDAATKQQADERLGAFAVAIMRAGARKTTVMSVVDAGAVYIPPSDWEVHIPPSDWADGHQVLASRRTPRGSLMGIVKTPCYPNSYYAGGIWDDGTPRDNATCNYYPTVLKAQAAFLECCK